MPDRSYLYRAGPLENADLDQAEQDALAGDTLLNQTAARLLVEVRRLRHELADPMFMYAGGRISRHAVVGRNADIERLQRDATRLSWLERRVKPGEAGYVFDLVLSGGTHGGQLAFKVKPPEGSAATGPDLRAAIDAAMAANKGT